jgi:DNA-binding helix-hairpin-helix protein with protein kinase domain
MASKIAALIAGKIDQRNRLKQERLATFLDESQTQGVAESVRDGVIVVKTSIGSRIRVKANQVVTNGEVVGQPLMVTRPRMGEPFVDAEIRG